MKMSEMFPSKYLKAGDLEGDTVLTIAGVVKETMKGRDGSQDEEKNVLLFSDSKPMVLNVTNGHAIESLYGDESDDWIGKKVTLYVAEVYAYGENTQALRVRDANYMKRKTATVAPRAKVVSEWNELAKRAKAEGKEAISAKFRPTPEADVSAIAVAVKSLRAALNAPTDGEIELEEAAF